jgi:hypothetical protein
MKLHQIVCKYLSNHIQVQSNKTTRPYIECWSAFGTICLFIFDSMWGVVHVLCNPHDLEGGWKLDRPCLNSILFYRVTQLMLFWFYSTQWSFFIFVQNLRSYKIWHPPSLTVTSMVTCATNGLQRFIARRMWRWSVGGSIGEGKLAII